MFLLLNKQLYECNLSVSWICCDCLLSFQRVSRKHQQDQLFCRRWLPPYQLPNQPWSWRLLQPAMDPRMGHAVIAIAFLFHDTYSYTYSYSNLFASPHDQQFFLVTHLVSTRAKLEIRWQKSHHKRVHHYTWVRCGRVPCSLQLGQDAAAATDLQCLLDLHVHGCRHPTNLKYFIRQDLMNKL